MKARVELVKDKVLQLLELMQQEAEIEVQEGENSEIHVKIKCEDPGILIGWKGKNLSSLQHILTLILNTNAEEWSRVIVDVNNYREEQEDRIAKMALAAAKQVVANGEAVVMGKMSPYERRIVHMALAEDEKVKTESEGEGEARHVVVYPKSE